MREVFSREEIRAVPATRPLPIAGGDGAWSEAIRARMAVAATH